MLVGWAQRNSLLSSDQYAVFPLFSHMLDQVDEGSETMQLGAGRWELGGEQQQRVEREQANGVAVVIIVRISVAGFRRAMQ